MQRHDAEEQPRERRAVLANHVVDGDVHRAVRAAQCEAGRDHGEQRGRHHDAELQPESMAVCAEWFEVQYLEPQTVVAEEGLWCHSFCILYRGVLEARGATGGSSSSSWQTVRAGLLSPPPQLNAAAILFSPPIAEEEETGETAAANGGEEEEVAKEGEEEEQEHEEGEAHGNGGWLVDLVEGWLDPPLPMPNRNKRLSTSDTTTSSSTPTQAI